MTPERSLVVKEFRALLPLWAACLVTMAARPFVDTAELEVFPVLAYAHGSVALGAHAIGHEYSYRTMSMLLTQPVDRRRLLIAKLGVLGVLLAVLAAAAQVLFIADFEPRPDPAIAFLPFFGGLFIATWLTMVMRNQLAGAVFTITIAGTVFVINELAIGNGFEGGDDEFQRFAGVARGLIAFSMVAAVLGWRRFMRLEAIEGSGGELHLPRVFGSVAASRDANPIWLLIRKELRLQQMSFVLAGFYVVVWAVLLVRGYGATGIDLQKFAMVFGPVTLIYFWGLSVLVGALPSAEERQLGVLQSQQLLPMSARAQWAIKAAVAIGVAVVLTVGVPAVLLEIASRLNLVLAREMPPWWGAVLLVTVITSCALYVSSVSNSSIRAVALAFPSVLLIVWALESGVSARGTTPGGDLALRWYGRIGVADLAIAIMAVPFAASLLTFAAGNHRTNERTLRRILLQVGLAAAIIVIGLPLITYLLLAI